MMKFGRYRGENMRMCRWWLVLVMISVCAGAQISNMPELRQRLQSLVDARFAATKCPGLSVAVASHNQIILSNAWGKADLEQNVPMTTASVHRLASLSKPITGTIIMDLVEQGKLGLDSPIRDYVPELPDSYQKVTIRHLLSHESGVHFAADDFEVVLGTKHYPNSREALKVIASSPSFEPGSRVEYSSAAFTLLGAAAEAVTGSSFSRVSTDFFAKHDLPKFPLDDPYALISNRVRGYLVDRKSKMELNDGRTRNRDYLDGTPGDVTNAALYDISNRYPAGGFDASAEDLLRFVIAVGSGKLLRPETLSQMWTAQKTSDRKTSFYGLGWGVSDWKGKTKMVGMNGLELSSQTFLRYLPQPGVGVVVLCNAEGAERIPVNEIVDATMQ